MFGKNIRYLRKKRDMSQADLAKYLGYNTSVTIHRWETGENSPPLNSVASCARLFGVTVDDLTTVDLKRRDADMLANVSNVSTAAARGVPVLGAICAGDGVFAQTDYDGVFFIDSSVRADLCLTVKGDSMTGACIYDGDKAFIRRDYAVSDGHVYAVLMKDDDTAVLRRVYWQKDALILAPCCSRYEPTAVKESDVYIIGECVGVYHEV